MTVIENVFEALPQDMDENLKVDKALKLLKSVRLDHRITHIARDLSGGEKQRCVLARQLAKDPILFLADEPTGNLDSKNSQEVLALLQTMSDRYQQTILMITHNKNHASAADRVFRMTDGVLKDLGVSSR